MLLQRQLGRTLLHVEQGAQAGATKVAHPLEIGSVPGTDRVYVSQDHAMGRLSFINVDNGEVRTVTGFELNSQVIE